MAEVLIFDSRQGQEIFISSTASISALGPSQPPIQWVPGSLSSGAKGLGREADHSPISSAEVRNKWIYTSTFPYVFMAQCLLDWAQGQLYLTTINACDWTNWSRSNAPDLYSGGTQLSWLRISMVFFSPSMPKSGLVPSLGKDHFFSNTF
jgi:hypothetical protein